MRANWRDLDFDEIPEWPVHIQNILLALGSVLLLVLAYFFVISPLKSDLDAEQRRELSLKTMFHSKAQSVTEQTILDEQIKSMNMRYREKVDNLPEKTELAGLLAGINDTGVKQNLTFQRLNWQKEVESDWLFKIPLRIELRGNYENISAFSSEVTRLPHIVLLHEFTLSRINNSPIHKSNLQFVVTAYTYRHVNPSGEQR